MMTIDQVDELIRQMEAEGAPLPDRIRRIAAACLGWPYVFGAWGEQCTPAGRKRRARSDHPTIVSKCPALNGKGCADCKWGAGVRMYDCRGFTAWLLRSVKLQLTGEGATSQWKQSNWAQKGPIAEMPDCVCCVFKAKGEKMEHTGMHLGGGEIIHCSVNVQTGKTSDRGWTHYAVPRNLYSEGEIPVTIIRPTIRKGAKGDLVRELQEILSLLGYDPGPQDGIFGTKTLNALVLFQTEAKLDPDGVCGPKTWRALYEAECRMPPAPADPVTYRVTCEGVTWEQYKRILEVCPLAEAEKEE